MPIEDYELFRQYRATKDVNLRNQIAEKYLYIAEIMAKKFSGRGVEFDDLYQVASLALLKGLERFDESLNLQFATFITPTITGEIKNYFRDKSRLIKLPRRLYLFSVELKKQAEKMERETGTKPTPKELARYFKTSEEQVLSALELGSSTVSLDSSVEGMESSLYEIIPDEKDSFEAFESNDELNSAISKLTENEKELVKLRFKDGLSQTEVSKIWNVSQMYISRLERKIIGKMQSTMFSDL